MALLVTVTLTELFVTVGSVQDVEGEPLVPPKPEMEKPSARPERLPPPKPGEQEKPR